MDRKRRGGVRESSFLNKRLPDNKHTMIEMEKLLFLQAPLYHWFKEYQWQPKSLNEILPTNRSFKCPWNTPPNYFLLMVEKDTLLNAIIPTTSKCFNKNENVHVCSVCDCVCDRKDKGDKMLPLEYKWRILKCSSNCSFCFVFGRAELFQTMNILFERQNQLKFTSISNSTKLYSQGVITKQILLDSICFPLY